MTGSGSDDEFRVTDRRRRAEAEDETPSISPDPRQSPTGSTRVGGPVERPTVALPQDEAAHEEAAHDEGAPEDAEATLEGLFMMLASSAVVAMGAAADPVSGQVRRDPAMAADAIDLLVLLRKKTEGHRTASETQLLEDLIYDLQLRYVAAMKQSG